MKATTLQLHREGADVRAILDHGKPVLTRSLARKNGQCVIATRAAVAAARAMGHDAYALVTTVVVFDAAIGERFLAETDAGRWPDDAAVRRWTDELHGWSIGLGVSPDRRPPGSVADDHWAGHLVAVVNRRWLVDLTVDQANRPDKGLLVDATAHRIPPNLAEAFLRGRHPLIGRADSGCVAVWIPRPADKSYKALPGWTRTDLGVVLEAVADAAIQRTPWPIRRTA